MRAGRALAAPAAAAAAPLPRLPAMNPPAKPWYRDWTQWVCPGPSRVFTAAELARGGQQPWPPGIDGYVYANVLVLALLNVGRMPPWALPLGLCVVLALCWAALRMARAIWVQPTRKRLNLGIAAAAFSFGLGGFALMKALGRDHAILPFMALLAMFVLATSSWWFLSLYRSQQIEARLQELDAQDEQLRLSRRLATAQIHPHFIFNTLASLTQWVETQDPRAAALLQDFNAYLRATLPMFEREAQTLREELELVRRYLAIMQARLGERLAWTLDHDPALDELPLPPGSLLTLVENAITHGIEPALRGGRIEIQTRRLADGRAELSVRDNGEGPPEDAQEGLGLSNTRARLQALAGPLAELRLDPLQPQGCEARMRMPTP